MNAQRKQLITLCAALLLFIGLGYLLLKPEPVDYPAYLSFSPDHDGTKALRLLLDEKDISIKEWRQSSRFLPEVSYQTLIMIEPRTLEPGEQESLRAWVERGNELILFKQAPEDWTEFAIAEIERQPSYTNQANPIYHAAGEEAGQAVVQSGYRLQASAGMEPLLSDQLGIIAAQTTLGAGKMTVFLTPEWLQNEHILQEDHFALLWPSLLATNPMIWIDEYHHGYQQNPGLMAVYPAWLLWITAQAALAVVLWLWWKGKRFGPVYVLREWRIRRGDETLLAIAGWYERRKLAKDAYAYQERYFRHLLQEKWGLSTQAEDDQIVEVARQHWNEAKANQLAELLQQLAGHKTAKRYPDKQFMVESRKIGELINWLEKE